MTNKRFAVTGIGNAIVDVLGQATDSFLAEEGLTKGTMALIDEARAEDLYQKLGKTQEQSGGSACNTMAGIASLGGKGACIGKVRNDALGDTFRREMHKGGVHFDCEATTEGPATARCLIVVTPDAQRTMSTFLGASVALGPDDIDPEIIADSQVTYLEGYLWDPPLAKEAFLRASTIAHDAGNSVSLSLSDPFCVERHRDDFLKLIRTHVDILFANEAEIKSLYQCSDFDEAARLVRQDCKISALTRGENGSLIVSGDETTEVKAAHVEKVLDTTGAGDLYAAGFLFGYTQGRALADCGKLGALAAAEVISHFGARPNTSLQRLIPDRS